MPETAELGELSVLNVRQGDIKVSFNSSDPMEVERARRIVEDMLRRGYILFVEVKGKLRKATGFDPKTDEYILADGPLYASPPMDEPVDDPEIPAPKRRGRPPGSKNRASAKSTRATGVPPTSGG